MMKYILGLGLILGATAANAQTNITIKDVANYVGKDVTLCDSVYSARTLDNLSLLNLGGHFPKETITVVVFKADRAAFSKEPVNLFEHKKVCVTGTVTLFKDKLQIVVKDPKSFVTK